MTAVIEMPRTIAADATTQWRRRVLRVSSLCQIGFGTFWLQNAIRPRFPLVATLALLTGVAALVIATMKTRGSAPRPSAIGARELETKLTIATVIQIAVSVVIPVALAVLGRGWLVMPVIIVSVGVLFVYLWSLVRVPRLGALGIALVVIPIVALATLAGTAQVTVMLLGAGALMVGNGAAGVRSLDR